ncbi:NADPH-dependent 1-acyl dihydroxyacetone phosphate reductase [Sporothrix eucalyptigena]|uniref:NADPH-dependent 1-acyl dihydroxyacetone phosphate reductase n=1 Tax=Sporothrix eucalyptigena TaxID=1812306 RepID=A0ABP0CWL6_9PEZI
MPSSPQKSALITGCSAGGIGHALAEAFQKQGLTVFATARSVSKMQALATLPNVTVLSLDVTSTASVTAAIAQVSQITGGRLDYLVNNAGQSGYMPALDVDVDDHDGPASPYRLFDVNFWGMLRMVQNCAPLLIETSGTVVNIGSVNGVVHPPLCSVYNATKAAVHSLGETLRMELQPLGVQVLTVVTGTIRTQIQANVPELPLPVDSRYHAVQPFLDAMHAGTAFPNKMNAAVYAQQVVGDILGGATGKVYRGTNAANARYAVTFLPQSFRDKILTGPTHLDEVGKK